MKALLVDDNPNTRQGLRLLLEMSPGLPVVVEAGGGEEALALVPQVRPDLVLLDLQMPGMDGLETIRRLRELGLPLRIVAMSMDPGLRDQAVAAGVDAFVDKIELGYHLATLVGGTPPA